MRRERGKAALVFFISVCILFTISFSTSDRLRGKTVEIIAPFFEKLTSLKHYIIHFFSPQIKPINSEKVSFLTENEEIKRLELENKLLYANFIQLLDLVDNEKNRITSNSSISARVIFRSPSSWFSSLWINVGEVDNRDLKNPVIGKNSPVLVGNSVIGVIDYLGKKQSRVRLITDSFLNPSVRAVRKENEETHYLAKGILRGSGKPLFRSNGNVLVGIGFNYDFSDEKGPARDLRTGEIRELSLKSEKGVPLLKVNDLLVTTGMDGVFPPDLNVAKITKIYPLKEGDYYYEIEAKPNCGNLDDISLVFVLPPVGFDFDDKPPLIGE